MALTYKGRYGNEEVPMKCLAAVGAQQGLRKCIFLSYTADMLLRVLPTVRELENESLGIQTQGVRVQSPVF